MSSATGKYLILLGGALLLIGLLIYFVGDRWSNWLVPGRLPGDIRIEGKNGSGFYFPLTTCLLISLLLSLLINLLKRFF